MIQAEGKPKYSDKNLSEIHSVYRTITWTDLGLNRGQRPSTNRLKHGTAIYILFQEVK